MNSVIIIVVFTAITVAAQTNTMKCKDIPLQCAGIETALLFSPFSVYRSSDGQMNCTQVAFTSYAGTNRSYTGSVIAINEKSAFVFDFVQIDDSIFQTKLCADGISVEFRVIYSAKSCRARASFCIVSCDQSGDSIQSLSCFGRTAQDIVEIDNFLSTLTIRLPTLYYNQNNCEKPRHCALYSF